MKDQTKRNSENLATEEELKTSLFNVKLVLGIFIILISATALLRFVLKMPISYLIFILFLIWVLAYLFYYYYIQRRKSGENLCNFYFIKSLVDLFLITVAIHFLGGVEWIGAIFYLTVLSWASAVLSKNRVFVLSFVTVFFYLALALLEYFAFLPHAAPFGYSAGLYQNSVYISVQVLVLTIVLLFISQNYGTLANNFKGSRKRLLKSQEKLEEAKNVLEIRVQSRTRELRKLAESLEEKVNSRTEEAQARVDELERFQRLAVGRELRMVELKKEIKKLKEHLKWRSK
jgi:low affinity Fe/Cu permease